MFDASRARLLLLSGTHRCAEAEPSGCTGARGKAIKTNCQDRSEYQNGDSAHSTANSFHVVHVAATSLFPGDLVVSLHSTKQDAFVLSDGTSQPTSNTSAVALMAMALSRSFPARAVEACNAFDGSPNPRGLSKEERVGLFCSNHLGF